MLDFLNVLLLNTFNPIANTYIHCQWYKSYLVLQKRLKYNFMILSILNLSTILSFVTTWLQRAIKYGQNYVFRFSMDKNRVVFMHLRHNSQSTEKSYFSFHFISFSLKVQVQPFSESFKFFDFSLRKLELSTVPQTRHPRRPEWRLNLSINHWLGAYPLYNLRIDSQTKQQ